MSEPLRWIRPNETVDMLYIDDRPADIQLAASVESSRSPIPTRACAATPPPAAHQAGDARDRRERERSAVRQHRRPGEGGHALGQLHVARVGAPSEAPLGARPDRADTVGAMEHVGAPKESSPTPRSARARGSASRAPVAPLPASAVALARMDGATQVTIARTLQQRAGNAAALRYLARAPSPAEAEGRPGATNQPARVRPQSRAGCRPRPREWTIGEQTAEIVWRMIWMFLPERISRTGVQTDAQQGRRAEVEHAPRRDDARRRSGLHQTSPTRTSTTASTILRLVFLEKDALIEKLKADFAFAAVTDGSSNWTVGELAVYAFALGEAVSGRTAGAGRRHLRRQARIHHGERPAVRWRVRVGRVSGRRGIEDGPGPDPDAQVADSAFVDRTARRGWSSTRSATRSTRTSAAGAPGRRRRDRCQNKTINTLNGARQAATAALNAGIRSANRYRAPDRAAANGSTACDQATHNAIEAFASSTSANAAARERAADGRDDRPQRRARAAPQQQPRRRRLRNRLRPPGRRPHRHARVRRGTRGQGHGA